MTGGKGEYIGMILFERLFELVQALLAFNLGGEQIFLPFYDETKALGRTALLGGL